jgi:hypothetical protein
MGITVFALYLYIEAANKFPGIISRVVYVGFFNKILLSATTHPFPWG